MATAPYSPGRDGCRHHGNGCHGDGRGRPQPAGVQGRVQGHGDVQGHGGAARSECGRGGGDGCAIARRRARTRRWERAGGRARAAGGEMAAGCARACKDSGQREQMSKCYGGTGCVIARRCGRTKGCAIARGCGRTQGCVIARGCVRTQECAIARGCGWTWVCKCTRVWKDTGV